MTFFIDVWHDLREKRLWPVAVGLLAAVVAIPVIMLKPAAEPTPPPAIPAVSAKPGTLPAVDVDGSPSHGSKLETFSQRNPFRPLAQLKKETPSSSPDGGSSNAKPAAGPTGSGAGGGASSGGGSSAGAPSGGGGSGSSAPSGGTGTRTQGFFRFTADVRFGAIGHAQSFKGIDPGTSLLADDVEKVLFVSFADGGRSAIFFVADQTLEAEGEGQCLQKCRFVKLGLDDAHDEETFTAADGSVGYELQLVRVNRETASKSDVTPDAKGKAAGRAKAAGAKPGPSGAARPLPRLIVGASTSK